MKAIFNKIALTATLGLALALTFSCSSDDDGGKEQGGVSTTEISSSSAGAKKSSSSGAVNESSSSIEGESSDSQPVGPVKKEKISGFSQKGPFTKGSAITLSELNDKLAQTGRSFEEMITDDKGSFEIKNIELASPYVMLKANGYYRNEVTGKISAAPINLYAITDIREKSNVNVNILTHLEYYRVQKLVEGGKSLKEAKKQAQKEILAVFGISGEFKDSEDMSIFGTTDGDAALLAISVLLQGDLSEGKFSERLADFNLGFKETGTWDNTAEKNKMADWAADTSNFAARAKYCEYWPTTEYPINCWGMPTEDNCLSGKLVNTCSNPSNDKPAMSMARGNILAWNLSSTVPDFEKFVNNYWYVNYGLGTCNTSSKGTIKNSNRKTDYICKDNAWEKATEYESDTYQWVCTEGEIKDGQVSGTKYICKDNAWVIPTQYDLDTYQWVCSKEGEVKESQANSSTRPTYSSSSNTRYYVCKNKDWVLAKYVDIKCSESESCQTFTDARDKQSYVYVKIGEQTWMAENLNYNASGSECNYNNPVECTFYGRQYDWNTAMKACPNGWHLPSNEEWDALISAVGGNETAGKYLQATSGCNGYCGNGEDKYGFSALSNAYNGGGSWWSASEYDSDFAYKWIIRDDVSYDTDDKSQRFISVRCVQD